DRSDRGSTPALRILGPRDYLSRPIVDVVEAAADAAFQPVKQRIIRPSVEVHAILTVARRDGRAAGEGVGDGVVNGEGRGFIVASIIGRVAADAELRQRPRSQSQRVV